MSPFRRYLRERLTASCIACLVGLAAMSQSALAEQSLKIAVAISLTGPRAAASQPTLNAVQLAIDEANAAGGQHIELSVLDDAGTAEGAAAAARQAAAEGALAVIGPIRSGLSLAAGPVYAHENLVSIAATADGDRAERGATTFQPASSTREMGAALAAYIRHIVDAKKVDVLISDDDYGRPMADGFRGSAEWLGLEATYHPIAAGDDLAAIAKDLAAKPGKPPIVLAMADTGASALVLALRRNGVTARIFGSSATASAAFAASFADEPEARQEPGFFTDGFYAITPSILGSANAETLAVAARYRARFGQDLQSDAVQAYDSAKLAIAAVRAAADSGVQDTAALRAAVLNFVKGLDSPQHALASLTGPLWFTPDHGRRQASRIGRFRGGQFESAPLQLVPAHHVSATDREADGVVEISPGRFARRQQVVHTGIYLNEISNIDMASSTVTADFYLWLRFANGAGTADPTEIEFPDLVRGNFNPARPVVAGDLDDGTTYRLWRVRGDFKNDFDLHHYPFDRQTLAMRLFNARAASDRIVYVQDRGSLDRNEIGPRLPDARGGAIAAPLVIASANGKSADGFVSAEAFRNLTLWEPTRVDQRRDILVTHSALGDPRLIGVARVHELSGFRLEVDVLRKASATLAKTLLPLGIMTLIMFASLYFPPNLTKEKVTVAITAALSGAVLLSAVNSQLGAVGYTMAAEYVFYLFFGLCLFCVISILFSERLHIAGNRSLAHRAETATRWTFLAAMVATAVAAVIVAARW